MEEYIKGLLIGSFSGSAAGVLITKISDYLLSNQKFKQEQKIRFFERKISAAESAYAQLTSAEIVFAHLKLLFEKVNENVEQIERDFHKTMERNMEKYIKQAQDLQDKVMASGLYFDSSYITTTEKQLNDIFVIIAELSNISVQIEIEEEKLSQTNYNKSDVEKEIDRLEEIRNNNLQKMINKIKEIQSIISSELKSLREKMKKYE